MTYNNNVQESLLSSPELALQSADQTQVDICTGLVPKYLYKKPSTGLKKKEKASEGRKLELCTGSFQLFGSLRLKKQLLEPMFPD